MYYCFPGLFVLRLRGVLTLNRQIKRDIRIHEGDGNWFKT